MQNIILNSASLRAEFSRETGALVRLTAPETGWEMLNRPELGLSFRLLVPLSEELRNNNVYGEEQLLSSYEETNDGLMFQWDNLKSERTDEILPIRVTMRIAVKGRQLVYNAEIENNSNYMVEAVHCPYLGDIQPPKSAEWLKSFSYCYASSQEYSMWPKFQNLVGYYGVDYPTQVAQWSPASATPCAPFYLVRSEEQGLYFGMAENTVEVVTWMAELRPGVESSIDATMPQSLEIAGKPVHTRVAAVHIPYIQPGETRALVSIALEAYQGGWHGGADIYKAASSAWLKPAKPPEWATKPHSWLQMHINSPEDELRLRFTELPKVAEECKRYGVEAIQLVGWNHGGQDQGNPSHDPDPRLGTFDELKEAIRKCHEIGVKIILFTKFIWADQGTKWFKSELKDYAITDPYGDYYQHAGYRYQTITQILDINSKRLIPMCFHSEPYMQICENEFKKVVELGAAGMLFDECLHHHPALVCFNTDHGHRYGAPVYAKDNELIHRFWKNTPGVSPDFLMAGEAVYDNETAVYQLSYHRSENKGHVPLSRYLQPHVQFMTAVTGFNDRNMVNQCLMHRYVISYEPYNFKGWLHDYPDTVAYGSKMDALRSEYRKWFWDGEFRDTRDAKVTQADGAAHKTFSTFTAEDGSVGAVICNYEDEAISVSITERGGWQFGKYRIVDEAAEHAYSGAIEIPARSAVVVI